ncbi:MAG: hypothetical protein Q9161_000482 [Pseudevernia consocians]
MQHGRRTTSITSYENLQVSQDTAGDADWLRKPTLSSSDHDLPPSKFDLDPSPDTEPLDEYTAPTAHLRDREPASDLDAYEWNSNDLVSEAFSNGENTSDEELPRLARNDEFKRNLRQDRTRNREYRDQWKEPHDFYKRRKQAGLEHGDNYEGHLYVEKEAWSARAEQDWVSAEGFDDVDCAGGSKEPWTGGKEWVECMRDDQEPWLRLVTSQTHDTDIVHEEGSTGTDERSGELPLWKQSPGRGPVSRNIAYREPSNTSVVRHFSKSAHISPSSFCDEISITDLNTLPLPRSSQVIKSALRNPERSPSSKDLESTNSEEATSSSNAALDEEQALNTFLDTCIRKTQALLADAENALHATAEAEQTSNPDSNRVSKDDEAHFSHMHSKAVFKKVDRGEAMFHVSAKNSDTTTPREIVRVERWWKVKGGEAWREVGGWVEENGYVL